MASRSEYQRALDKIEARMASEKAVYDALQAAQSDPAAALGQSIARLDALTLARVALAEAHEEKIEAKATAPKRTRKPRTPKE